MLSSSPFECVFLQELLDVDDLEGAIDRAVDYALLPAFEHIYEQILDEVRSKSGWRKELFLAKERGEREIVWHGGREFVLFCFCSQSHIKTQPHATQPVSGPFSDG